MKLPALRSAPVQRLETPNAEVAAAPMRALGSIGKEIGDFIDERNKETAAADYTNRLGEIESADQEATQFLQSTPYMRVTDVPDGVEVPKGATEQRYDPESDTIMEFVPTDEISGDLYDSFMSEVVTYQTENSRNNAVAARLQSDAIGRARQSRAALFKDHLVKSKARNTAKITLELERAIGNEDEVRVNEIIARASMSMGIDADEARQKAYAKIDEQYFVNASQRATTASEVESLKDELADRDWRFDSDVKKSTYTMLIKREGNLDKAEGEELVLRQNAAFVDAMGTVSTEGMTVDQVNELKWLKPDQYIKLLNAAQTDSAAFKTPESTRLWSDRQIQSVARGDYSLVGADNFQDAQEQLRTNLENLMGSPDPFTDDNYTQKMSAADYAKYSGQIDDLEQIGYENKQVTVGKSQIYLMVAGASQEAFDFNPDKDAERQIALNDAIGDYYQYIEKAGPDAEPMKWVEDNLYKYTAGPAKASLMGLDSNYQDIRGAAVWVDGGMRLDFDTMKAGFVQELNNAKAQGENGNAVGIANAERALSQLDAYREAYPLNVR